MKILRIPTIVTIDIFYYMPDHSMILNEFIWQTEDVAPEYTRVHKFLNFWKNNIKATIQEILMCESTTGTWRSVDFDLKFH